MSTVFFYYTSIANDIEIVITLSVCLKYIISLVSLYAKCLQFTFT